ncbi:MAG TPA: DUF742 domain-containing protein [Pseudonocardiaceae bacterium]
MVPLYLVTGGQAHPSHPTLRPETLLIAARPAPDAPRTTPEQAALLRMCRGRLALAEAAVALDLPISVVRVLASALLVTRQLTLGTVAPATGPDPELLEKVLNGLRNLR